MENKQVTELLGISIDSINKMIDTSKVIGEPIILNDNKMLIPILKISVAFGSGGSEFNKTPLKKDKDNTYPFGGGTIGGILMNADSFILINEDNIKIIDNKKGKDIFTKSIDLINDILEEKKNKKN